ncbi:MAG: SDR family NAD(P)-dependent oxidoreductase [Alphaproteobacteria bacterium]|nr:SDR family NAD(P)-dependent oxidoreductase [Alphaproteobacteria bacterium]
MTRLRDKVALVTGASRGIGAALGRRLAAEGAHVVLVARTIGGLEEVDDAIRASGGTATLVPMDLREGEAIDRLALALHGRFGRLDILVGNAAVLGGLSPLGHYKPETWAEVMDVNLTANWRLIRAFDGLLRAAPDGRAVFVTSGAARRSRAYWGPYAASKAGLEAMVRSYADELANTRVRVNLADPGRVQTRMRALAYPGEDPSKLADPVAIAERLVEAVLPTFTRHGEIIELA